VHRRPCCPPPCLAPSGGIDNIFRENREVVSGTFLSARKPEVPGWGCRDFSDLGPRPISISTPSTPRARVSQRSSRGTKSMSSDRLGKARGGGCIPACAGSAGFGVAAAGRIAPAAGGDGIADSATSR